MSAISVKGEQDGLVVTLPPEGGNAEVLAALRAHLVRTGDFFRGAKVTLDVGVRALPAGDLRAFQALLGEWEVRLEALRATDEATRNAGLALGLELPFVTMPAYPAPLRQPAEVPDESADALLVRRTVRSGQVVRHPGAVIVLGDVNPGAEIVAGGDVLVWGALRGVVHAGASGDPRAIVCALRLAPSQLRIDTQIAMGPEGGTKPGTKRLQLWRRLQSGPEIARLHDGFIVVEPWKGTVER